MEASGIDAEIWYIIMISYMQLVGKMDYQRNLVWDKIIEKDYHLFHQMIMHIVDVLYIMTLF